MSNVVRLPVRDIAAEHEAEIAAWYDEPPPDPEAQIPPHDLVAEGAFLAAALLEPSQVRALRALVRPEQFYSEAHRRIWEAVLAQHDAGQAIDIVTVGGRLRDTGRLEQVGGLAYLSQVCDEAPAIGHPPAYAKTIVEKWRLRRVIALCQATCARGYAPCDDPQALIDEHLREVGAVARAGTAHAIERNVDALKRLVRENTERMRQGKSVGLLTGISPLDDLTGGLHAAQKTSVVALPGRGKTVMGLQMAVAAAKQRVGCLFFSLELTHEQVIQRLTSQLAGFHGDKWRTWDVTATDWDRLQSAGKMLADLPLEVDTTQDLHVGHIRERVYAAVERFRVEWQAPLGVVVVDYVQYLRPAPEVERAKRHEQVAHATKALKDIAKELRIAVVELAQQKPAEVDKHTKTRPRPGSGCVADSSVIEKSADVLMYLHRKPLVVNGKVIGESQQELECIVAKCRAGREESFDLRLDGAHSRFIVPAEVWP